MTHLNAKSTARPDPEPVRSGGGRNRNRVRRGIIAVICAAVVAGAAIAIVVTRSPAPAASKALEPVRYLGVYERDAPLSYAGIDQFARSIGKQPDVVSYYSSWLEPFQAGFATLAAQHGAVPLVQINPARQGERVSIAAIAAGQYDAYLRAYASAVRSYRHQVILSFGHEMNGWWFNWGYRDTAPATFVAAWRHIVTLFRGQGADNVTWLWTINIVDSHGGIRLPAPWWPGRSYVNWVGIDGYYFKSSWTFAPLFGPTIKAVRALTRDPIIISETGAATVAGKPAKVADLFNGVRAYGLLGFVWFNAREIHNWSVDTPAVVSAFRRATRAYQRPAP